MSFASRMRSISCSVLSARASARSGVASSASPKAPNHSAVNVVGSPTMRSDGLRSEAQLEADGLVVRSALLRGVEGSRERWPRISRVIACEEPDLGRPGHALGVSLARLEADEDGFALARKHADVVALHAPEVRQVEDVVGRSHDERVEPALAHERAHAVELRVVPRPAHTILRPPRRFRSGRNSGRTFRSMTRRRRRDDPSHDAPTPTRGWVMPPPTRPGRRG